MILFLGEMFRGYNLFSWILFLFGWGVVVGRGSIISRLFISFLILGCLKWLKQATVLKWTILGFCSKTHVHVSFYWHSSAPLERETLLVLSVACEQAPVGDSRVQSRANGMNRERSGEEGVCREPVDIPLMPPFHDTSSWYQDLIGWITDCWQLWDK